MEDFLESREIYRFIKENKGKYAFLAGAGLSKESGIKTSKEIIEYLKTKIYRKYHGGKKANRKIINEWLENQMWFKNASDKYSAVLNEYFPNKGQRKEYFNKLIKGKKPSDGHKYLANIVNAGYVKNILTTNFDRLIERSFSQAELDPIVINHETDIQNISLGDSVNVIKLHGDYLYENLANIEGETKRLSKNMEAKLEASLENHGLIIIGYSGNDTSVKDLLIELIRQEKFLTYGLYWGVREESEINKNMREIISLASKKGSSFFKIHSARQFFLELNNNLDLGIPTAIDQTAYLGIEVSPFSKEINKKMEIQGGLVERPLITKEDIEHCFFKTGPAAEFMKHLDQQNFQGSWILKSPEGTGKTSLLTYICLKARQDKFGKKIFIVKRVPVNFDVTKFSSYLLTSFRIKMRSKKRILLTFDDIQDNPHYIHLMQYISDNYKNATILSSIRAEKFQEFSDSLKEIKDVQVVDSPGYIDTYEKDFKNIIKEKLEFVEKRFLKEILKKKLVTFSHFVRLYRNLAILKISPQEAIDDFRKSLNESFLNQYLKLSEDEKLTVKLISWFEEIPSALLYAILKEFKIKPKKIQRLLKEKGIIYREKESRSLLNKIYRLKIIKIIEQMKEVANEHIVDLEKEMYNNLIFKFMDLEWRIKREGIVVLTRIKNKLRKLEKDRLERLIEEIKGNLYCASCKDYFTENLELCPQCGRNLSTGEYIVFCEKYNSNPKIAESLGLCMLPRCIKIPFPNKQLIDTEEAEDINLEKLIIPKI